MLKEKLYKKIKESNKTRALNLFDDPIQIQKKSIYSDLKRISGAVYIPIDRIKPLEISIREEIQKDNEYEIFVLSIKNNKVIAPLVVYYNEEDDSYYIIIGKRRFLAAIDAGLDEVPCLLKKEKPDDKDILIEALIENLHRKNLTVLELAKGFQFLINEYGYLLSLLRNKNAPCILTRARIPHLIRLRYSHVALKNSRML